MQSIKIEKIIGDHIFNYNSGSINVIKKILNHCRNTESLIITKSDDIVLLKVYDLLHTVDYIYKSIGLMMILTDCSPKIGEADKMVSDYLVDLYSNSILYDRLTKIKNKSVHFGKIIKKFQEKQNKKIKDLCVDINNVTENIRKSLNTIPVVTNAKIIRSLVKTNVPSEIKLNKANYFILQKKIKNPEFRKEIEEIYFKKTEGCLSDFSKILILRHKLALEFGHSTFFEHIKHNSPGESLRAKELIKDLILKLQNRSKKELVRIQKELNKDGFKKKVDLRDIIYYYEKFKSVSLFSPSYVIAVIFQVLQNLFGVSFNEITYKEKLWCNSIKTFLVKVNNVDKGYVHIDLLKSDRCGVGVFSIQLCNRHVDEIGNMKLPQVALICNYSSGNDKCITYSDIVHLFREFGNIVQTILRPSYDKNDDFFTLMAQIMEFIAWEKTIISKLCKGGDNAIVDHILFTRYINFANSIKMRCVNSLFDHTIHNSSDFIKMLEDNSLLSSSILLKVYKKIYHDVMFSNESIINLDVTGISPTVIFQEINGSEGSLYSSILTEILSFSVYSSIKNNKGKEFINNIICSDNKKLKELLYKFITDMPENSYDLYLKEVIGHDEIDTELNILQNEKIKNTNAILTETNHFSDSTNSSEDEEKVTYIEKQIDLL